MIEHITRKLTHFSQFAAAMYATGTSADDLEAPLFSFSSFGTLVCFIPARSKRIFSSSILKPDGAGYRHTWSADVDNL